MSKLDTGFSERLKAQAEAKKALLAKFKPKPTVTASTPIDRTAEKEAAREALRQNRAAEKEARLRRQDSAPVDNRRAGSPLADTVPRGAIPSPGTASLHRK